MEFTPATREAVQPLIAISGESNSGKTFSALLLARGLVGPTGKVALIDTESGRGALYANSIPGGYLRGDLIPPFSPDAYHGALDAAEASGAGAIVVDSFSHEWEGSGGVVEMAGDNEDRTRRPGLHCWKEPKMAHQRLILRLMRSKVPVICCLRAKYKTRNVAEQKDGRTIQVPKKDDFLTPIQSDGFAFEATIILEMDRKSPGNFKLVKWSVPEIAACFPGAGPTNLSTEKVSVAHGEALARWCKSNGDGSASASAPTPKKPADPEKKALAAAKKALWESEAANHDGDINRFKAWLAENNLLPDGKTLETLTIEDVYALQSAIENIRAGGGK